MLSISPRIRALARVAAGVGVALAATSFSRPSLDAAAVPAFHLRLVKSEPAQDESVASPATIRLWFSESPTLAVTSLRLRDSADRAWPLGKPRLSGDAKSTVEATVTGALPPGTYRVLFRTASRDMHPVTGDVEFVVR